MLPYIHEKLGRTLRAEFALRFGLVMVTCKYILLLLSLNYSQLWIFLVNDEIQ